MVALVWFVKRIEGIVIVTEGGKVSVRFGTNYCKI